VLVALTRPVPPSIAECELTHLQREPIDRARATQQHEEYEAVLRSLGCTVRRVPADPSHADSVFIEDTAVVLDECAIITRPGAASRRGETTAVADALRPYRRLFTIQPPGTLDGGDVLRVGHRVYVGMSSRTNADGAHQLAHMLEPFGFTTTTIAVRGCLHLKTAVTALGDDRVLLNPRMVDASALGAIPSAAKDLQVIEVDPAEPMAANVLSINGKLLCSASAPRTRRLLENEGYSVIPVDASELAKAEGGLTCCSLLLSLADEK